MATAKIMLWSTSGCITFSVIAGCKRQQKAHPKVLIPGWFNVSCTDVFSSCLFLNCSFCVICICFMLFTCATVATVFLFCPHPTLHWCPNFLVLRLPDMFDPQNRSSQARCKVRTNFVARCVRMACSTQWKVALCNGLPARMRMVSMRHSGPSFAPKEHPRTWINCRGFNTMYSIETKHVHICTCIICLYIIRIINYKWRLIYLSLFSLAMQSQPVQLAP